MGPSTASANSALVSSATVIAAHPYTVGRRQRIVDPQHLAGIVGSRSRTVPDRALLRPLAAYALSCGGAP
jgi:hypothetical protein